MSKIGAKKHLKLLTASLLVMVSVLSTAFSSMAETKEKEEGKVYSIETVPYSKGTIMKKALKETKDLTSFVYLESVPHIFTGQESFKQTDDKTEFIYYGDIKKGAPSGKGIILMKESGIFVPYEVGEFKNGYMNGYGYRFKAGSLSMSGALFLEYEGDFKNGNYHGKGKSYYSQDYTNAVQKSYDEYAETLKDEDIVEVEYDVTVCMKFPIAFSSSYISYEGQYKKGSRSGKGTEYSGGYVLYKGKFKNGQWHGKGKEYYTKSTQLKYSGNFKNGEYHGTGTLYGEDGKVLHKGKFKDGSYD